MKITIKIGERRNGPVLGALLKIGQMIIQGPWRSPVNPDSREFSLSDWKIERKYFVSLQKTRKFLDYLKDLSERI
jgi:hypothetical protein